VVGLLGAGFPVETFSHIPPRSGNVPVHEYGRDCDTWMAADARALWKASGNLRIRRLAFLRAAAAKFAAMLF
jgi:hypothetical protein